MQRYFLAILTCLLLNVCVLSVNMTALRAGTISITDSDIRSSQKFNLQIDIQMNKEYKQKRLNIGVIASITSLQMDDQLSFYFQYDIICPSQKCFLNFTFVRKTKKVNALFSYSLTIDYLIARGMKLYHLNMTSYQEHIQVSDIVTFDDNNKILKVGDKLPRNNEDALRILLFPNGWSNVTRTGRVVYLYAMGNQMYMYVIHYMQQKSISGHDNGDFMGWPEKADFINYQAIFLDYDYLPDGCKFDDKWELKNNYQKQCLSASNDLQWFFGFKRTRDVAFSGQFYDSRKGFTFSVDNQPTFYGTIAFPFRKTEEFIDLRSHSYRFLGSNIFLQNALKFILLMNFLAVIGWILFKIVVKILKKKEKLKQKFEQYSEVENTMTPKSEVNTIEEGGEMG